MLSKTLARAAPVVSRNFGKHAGFQAVRFLSDKPLPPKLPGLSDDQIEKIFVADTGLRNRHILIEGDMTDEERDVARRKRMIYRSKQRGWLEADLLLGSWAVENVPGLTDEELDQYEEILKVETIDIYNYVSMKDVPPDHLKDLPLMKRLQAFALRRDMVAPEGYAAVKRKSNMT